MSEEQLAAQTTLQWTNGTFWSVALMFIAGTIGRSLVSSEPFCAKKFFGELILSGLAAVVLYSFNVMQGMSPIQIVFFGALGGMGGIRVVEWVIKFAKKCRASGVL